MINKIENAANTEDKKRLLLNFLSLAVRQGGNLRLFSTYEVEALGWWYIQTNTHTYTHTQHGKV